MSIFFELLACKAESSTCIQFGSDIEPSHSIWEVGGGALTPHYWIELNWMFIYSWKQLNNQNILNMSKYEFQE